MNILQATQTQILVENISIVSGAVNNMWLNITLEDFAERFKRWRHDGELIQIAFCILPDEQREFLMTGITPDEWDAMFPEIEED